MDVEGVETLYQGWGRLLRVTLRAPDGAVFTREMEDHGEAAVVLPYDPDRRMALLVTQPRTPLIVAGIAAPLLEAPAGRIDATDADPAAAARREAMEEAGVALGPLEPLGAFWTMPAISTERLHLFLARYAGGDRIGAGGGLAEEQERISVAEVPLDTLFAAERAGQLLDLKTAYMVAALRARLGG